MKNTICCLPSIMSAVIIQAKGLLRRKTSLNHKVWLTYILVWSTYFKVISLISEESELIDVDFLSKWAILSMYLVSMYLPSEVICSEICYLFCSFKQKLQCTFWDALFFLIFLVVNNILECVLQYKGPGRIMLYLLEAH